MHRRTTRAEAERVSSVLAGLAYPAAKWQLLMHAEECGADASTRTELWSLPVGDYPDLRAVLDALAGAAAPETIPGQRSAEVLRYPVPAPRPLLRGAGLPYEAVPPPRGTGPIRPLV